MPEPAQVQEHLLAELASIRALAATSPEEALRRLVSAGGVAGFPPAEAAAVVKLGMRAHRGLMADLPLRAELESLLDRLDRHSRSAEGSAAMQRARAADASISQQSAARTTPGLPAFRCAHLRKTWPGGFSLGELDLELRAGEITGVVGQNAHGKTTLLRLVAGELAATAGTLAYPAIAGTGTSAGAGPDWMQIKGSIAYVPQELPVWRGRLLETLLFEAATHGVDPADNEREVDFIVTRLGLSAHIGKAWSELSGGFKLRFALARALVWKPRLLILDEPLANLDVLAKSALLEDIRDLARSARDPIAILLSSHDLFDLERVCHQMVFLRSGEVVYSGPASGVDETGGTRLYLLTTTASEARLRAALEQAGITDVREEGLNFLVRTPPAVDSRALLGILLGADVVPDYFRDISRSIRRLFE